jgi:hypothetical protein
MPSFAGLRKILFAIAACLSGTAATTAQADFVPTGYAAGAQQFGLSIGGSPSAGGFQGNWNGSPIVFWCIELTQTFSFGGHYTNYTPSSASNTLLSKLFTEAFASSVTDAKHSAAFQLAIWEIVYDSGDLHLDAGTFKVLNNYGHPDTIALAQSYLDGLSTALASYTLTYLSSPNHQDFVTASTVPVPPTHPVPEPATAALLAAAFFCTAAVRRVRGKQGMWPSHAGRMRA